MPQCIYMIGDLSEGFKPYGPFETLGDCADWAEVNELDGWIMELHNPEGDDNGSDEETQEN